MRLSRSSCTCTLLNTHNHASISSLQIISNDVNKSQIGADLMKAKSGIGCKSKCTSRVSMRYLALSRRCLVDVAVEATELDQESQVIGDDFKCSFVKWTSISSDVRLAGYVEEKDLF
jgi:hypothetical protein